MAHGFLNTMMKRMYFYFLSLSLPLIFFNGNAYAQGLQVSGIVDDVFRKPAASALKGGATAKIQASTAPDTLRLPFFEDFSGVVVPIDSITVTTSDNLVKVHSKALDNMANGEAVFVGFEAAIPLTLSDTLSKKRWYINQLAPAVYSIDSSSTLTTPFKAFGVNTAIYNAFWRSLKIEYPKTADTLKWVKDGHVYVNNRFPVNPVSFEVGTFDGLKTDGTPYSTVNVLAKGYSDQLTSHPLDLSGLSAVDNVYFSFFWQHNGIGDIPETEDFLEVQFLDNQGVWITELSISGNTTYMTDFTYEIIQLTNANYFYKGFTFRIRSYGRLSGPYDIWNVDYIYLNKNRTVLDSRIFDFSLGNTSVSFLKNYTAMPYNQYFANKANEIGVLDFTTNNLDRNLTTNQALQGQCILSAKAGTYSYYYKDVAASHSTGNSTLTYQDVCSLLTDSLQDQNEPLNVKITYNLLGSTDTSNILFAPNNTKINSVVLWDYYAYDDGSAEWGVAANQSGAKVANQYTLNLKDTITSIDMYFTRSKGPNMDGRSILVTVWDKDYNIVSQQVGQVRYGGFIRYYLATPAIIEAGEPFYVGYQQNFVELLTVGYDLNKDHSNKVYFSLGSNAWNAYDQQPGYVKGSMMIRPVLGKGEDLLLSNKEKELVVGPELYPNPATTEITITGKLSKVSIYSLTGLKVIDHSYDGLQLEQTLSLAGLAPGIYIGEIFIGENRFVKKILVR